MRTFSFCLFILFSWNIAQAQLLVGPKLGVQVGQVQFEKQSFQDQYDPNYKLGFNLGGAITFPVIEPFTLHAELLFSSKGKSITIPEESVKNIGQYYYVEMPIMMRFKIWPEKGVFLGVGPNLSYWMGGTGKIIDLETPSNFTPYNIHFGPNESPNDLQVTDANRLQLGLLFGLGGQFDLPDDKKFTVEVRYEMGHSFLGTEHGANIENLEFSDNLESKHTLLSLNLGYFWTIHKKSAKNKSSIYKAKKRDD